MVLNHQIATMNKGQATKAGKVVLARWHIMNHDVNMGESDLLPVIIIDTS